MSERRYLTGDADQGRVELVVQPPNGNGDWYVSIVPEGHNIARLKDDDDRGALYSCVRVVTSGERRGQEHVAGAVAVLYRAMGGDGSAMNDAIRLREERDEALALLGDDGATLGLVEAIKRRSYLLYQANHALSAANAENEQWQNAAACANTQTLALAVDRTLEAAGAERDGDANVFAVAVSQLLSALAHARAAAIPASVAEAMVRIEHGRTVAELLDMGHSYVEDAECDIEREEKIKAVSACAANMLRALAVLTAEREQSR